MFRQHGRTVIRCPMLLKHETLGVLEVFTRDISASGMFISEESPDDFMGEHFEKIGNALRVGDELFAEVESNEDDNADMLHLKVARVAEDGFAITFVQS